MPKKFVDAAKRKMNEAAMLVMKKTKQLVKRESSRAPLNSLTKDESKIEHALNAAISRILPSINPDNFDGVVESLSAKSGIHPLVIAERIQLFQQLAAE